MKMFTSRLIKFGGLLALLVFSRSAMADFKSDIIKSCTAYQQGADQSDINACKLYIDGFIDASILSDNAAIKPEAVIENQENKSTSFIRRAYATRVTARASVQETDEIYEFCLPAELERKDIVSQAAKSMNILALEQQSLKQVLFQALVQNFPCSLPE